MSAFNNTLIFYTWAAIEGAQLAPGWENSYLLKLHSYKLNVLPMCFLFPPEFKFKISLVQGGRQGAGRGPTWRNILFMNNVLFYERPPAPRARAARRAILSRAETS